MGLETPKFENSPKQEDSPMERHKGFMEKAWAETEKILSSVGIGAVSVAAIIELTKYLHPDMAQYLNQTSSQVILETIGTAGAWIYGVRKVGEYGLKNLGKKAKKK